VDHVLAVSELYVRLRESERSGELELLSFEAEPACWRRWQRVSGEQIAVKPDVFVILGIGEIELHQFVEVDRSTESGTVLRRKLMAYVDYWQAGVEQAHRGIFPRVVWLVPDEHRKAQLVSVMAKLPPDSWHLFTAGLFENAISHLSAPSSSPEGGSHDGAQ
jgi:hypothetical protein